MINIFGYDIALTKSLYFLNGLWGSLLSTLVIVLVLALVFYYLLFFLINLAVDNENIHLILILSRMPFLLIVMLFGFVSELRYLSANPLIEKTAWIFIVLVATSWAIRLLRHGILSLIAKTDGVLFNDAVIPVLQPIILILLWIISILVIFYVLEINLTGLYVALGGTAIIFGLVLQSILSNLLSGLIVLIDKPFQFGDVIVLEDDTIVVIKKIGLRVTHLYEIKTHSDVFMPNSTLANMNIVNITRPTTDLAMSVKVSVSLTTDVDSFTNVLTELILGHPDVLGDIDSKLMALGDFSELTCGESKKDAARNRLLIEKELNEKVLKIQHSLLYLVRDFTTPSEFRNKGKRNQQRIDCVKTLNELGLQPLLYRRIWLKSNSQKLLQYHDSTENNLIQLTRKWYQAWSVDPDLVEEDHYTLMSECEEKITQLQEGAEKLYKYVIDSKKTGIYISDYLRSFAMWIVESYKSPRVLWKDPSVYLVEFEASALNFELSFYIDNLKLEHWARAERIKSELRREIVHKFKMHQIEIPFSQVDIWFRNPISHIAK